jgi:hypothetical protein
MRTTFVTGGRILLAAMLLFVAGARAADAPEGATPIQGGAAGSEAAVESTAPIAPSLPENAAELEAIKSGQMSLELPPAQTREPAPLLTAPEVQARMEAFERVIAQQTATVGALQARLAGATDNQAALAIQQEIQAAKLQGQIQIMQIQADQARLAGRVEQAEQIEAAIARMTGPAPAGQPVDRPAPVRGQQPSGR